MQDDILNKSPFDEKPSNNRAYWVQGLENGVWKNLEHFPSGQEAIAHIGKYVTAKAHEELKLVSATFSPITEKIKYKHLATISNGNVIRPDSREIIVPVPDVPAFESDASTDEQNPASQSTRGNPYGAYAFEDIDHPVNQINTAEKDIFEDAANSSAQNRPTHNHRWWPYLLLLLFGLFGVAGGFYLYNPAGSKQAILQVANSAYEFYTGEQLIGAISRDDISLVNSELALGANPDMTDIIGTPIVSIAIARDNDAIVKSLLNAGANPNGRTLNGSPFLLYYAELNNLEMVQFLIDKNADLNAAHPSAPCVTALSKATENNFGIIKILLIEYGASQNLGGECVNNLAVIETPPTSQLETTLSDPMQTSEPLLSDIPEPAIPPQVSAPELISQFELEAGEIETNEDSANSTFGNSTRFQDGLIPAIRRAFGGDK